MQVDAINIPWNSFIPHAPSEKQHAYLWLMGLEGMYGGAAGGGKSDALLMAALQFVHIPGYSAILFRKTFPELKMPGGLIFRSHEWLASTEAKWNDNEKTWKFPSGATVSFGYLQHENDKLRYQGSEFQFVGFDELTQFKQADYTYLFSRLRRLKGARVPIRMRSATNPGGPGHRWVRDRFIRKVPTMDTEREWYKAKRRIFIPASIYDNEYIDQDMYVAALDELDEHTRAQLLLGDWNARPPGNWMLDHRHIDAFADRGAHLRAMLDEQMLGDPAGVDYYGEPAINLGIDWGEMTQGYPIWELERGGVFVPAAEPEAINEHGEPGDFADQFIERVAAYGYPIGSARYDAAGVQSMRTFAKTVRNNWEGLEKLKTAKIPFNKYKRESINYMRRLGRRTMNREAYQILGIDPENERLLDQLYAWERKDEESDDAKKEDDHGPDAIVAGIAPLAVKHRLVLNEKIRKAKGDMPTEEFV